jgi:hypothetical protein
MGFTFNCRSGNQFRISLATHHENRFDTEDQLQTTEEAGKTWGNGACGETWGQTQHEASETECEARVGVTRINQICNTRMEDRKLEHTKTIVIQAGDCSQLETFLGRPAFINS